MNYTKHNENVKHSDYYKFEKFVTFLININFS